jgi:di/tricarboxylate transporter
MTFQAWISTATVLAAVVLMGATNVAPYLVLLGAVVFLLVLGILTPATALAGFGNEGVVTVAALFVVAAALNETGAFTSLIRYVLGTPNSVRDAQARLVLPVTLGSAFLNNTPVVAMLMPVVTDWARRARLPASQLLIPLSYAAILGGLCTLIGTSTNLIVHGLLLDAGMPGLRMFDLTTVGVPCAIFGALFLLLFGKLLLPDRGVGPELQPDPREYTLEMVVVPGGPLVGRTVEQAGLRHLPGIYLMEIHRRGHLIPVVGPNEQLDADDQLIFVGVVDSVMDLQKITGLAPARQQLFKLDAPRSERWFVEAVVSPSCPLIGQTIRDGRFRTHYNAVVFAVARNGARIRSRIGDIVLQPGDVLLLEALPSFVEQQRNSSDFYVVSRFENSAPPRHEQQGISLAIFAGMVVVAATGLLSMLQAALLAAVAMLATRCCSDETARRSIDWTLLVAIAASFGLGHALDSTGAARTFAESIIPLAGSDPRLALAVIFFIAAALSAVVTNNATAVIVFPIALATAQQLQADPMPFIIALAMGSSASFATPIGYQTNLMVYGAGRYRFADFLRIGIPMTILVWILTTVLTPFMWPF